MVIPSADAFFFCVVHFGKVACFGPMVAHADRHSSNNCPVESPCERALLLTLPVKCAHDHHACLVYTHIAQLG